MVGVNVTFTAYIGVIKTKQNKTKPNQTKPKKKKKPRKNNKFNWLDFFSHTCISLEGRIEICQRPKPHKECLWFSGYTRFDCEENKSVWSMACRLSRSCISADIKFTNHAWIFFHFPKSVAKFQPAHTQHATPSRPCTVNNPNCIWI